MSKSEIKKVQIAKAGTMFRVGKTNAKVMLRDDNCIWYDDNTVYFTKEGWREYTDKMEYLSEGIDKMRDL